MIAAQLLLLTLSLVTPAQIGAWQQLELPIQGEVHEVSFLRYEEPRLVTAAGSDGSWSTPAKALRSYVAALANMESWADIEHLRRTTDGGPAAPPADAQRMAAESRLLAEGGVTVFGELQWRDYTVFLYRFVKGIPRTGGLPFQPVGDRFLLVTDLALAHPVTNFLSKLEWDAPTAAAFLAEGHADPEAVAAGRVNSGLPILARDLGAEADITPFARTMQLVAVLGLCLLALVAVIVHRNRRANHAS